MIHIKQRLIRLASLGVLLSSLCHTLWAQEGDKPQNLPVVQLSAGIHKIHAMVAKTSDQRQIGLMFRDTMGPNEGMLFIFESPARQCFWMKNTHLPLSAAFIGEDGKIVNIADMAPRSLESHCSEKPVRFVLEMHQGWFKKRGLKAGDRIGGVVLGNEASR